MKKGVGSPRALLVTMIMLAAAKGGIAALWQIKRMMSAKWAQ